MDSSSSLTFQAIVLATGAFVAIWPSGVFVARLVAPFRAQLQAVNVDAEGLSGAGTLIGRLERALIFVFVVAGAPSAVGFLIAAKSILRFGEDRRAAEYIIIGTLASFLLALVVAYTTRLVLTL